MGSTVPDFQSLRDARHYEVDRSSEVRVLSWNLLADCCFQKYHGYAGYSNQKRHELLRIVLEKFIFYKAVDIFCLQEVDEAVMTAIEEVFAHYSYKAFKTISHSLSCTILYNKSKLEVVACDAVDMNDLSTRSALQAPAKGCTSCQDNIARKNSGLILILRHLQSQKEFVVANTQLYWDPQFEYIKLCQAHYLCQRIELFTKKIGLVDAPVIVCGDFNSKPGGLVHKYFTKGIGAAKVDDLFLRDMARAADMKLDVMEWLLSDLSCPFRFRSSYASESDTSQECYPFTNVTDTFQGFVDYIFFQPAKLLQVGRLPLPATTKDLEKTHKAAMLPSLKWPSDHLPVGAKFSLLQHTGKGCSWIGDEHVWMEWLLHRKGSRLGWCGR